MSTRAVSEGQRLKSALAKPVVVIIDTVLKTAWRAASSCGKDVACRQADGDHQRRHRQQGGGRPELLVAGEGTRAPPDRSRRTGGRSSCPRRP